MIYYLRLRLLAITALLMTIYFIPSFANSQQPNRIFVPAIFSHRTLPTGFETHALTNQAVFDRASELRASWVRLNILSWRDAQPTPTAPISFSAPSFQEFENAVSKANQLGLNVIAIVDDYPEWATGAVHRCSPIQDQHLSKYADFMRTLVARYSQAPFYVRYWELGNEPDVDPSLVLANSPYGCWGNLNDEYYGGERYGRMLNVVAPAIRAADPGAKIVFGGLLLDRPTTRPNDPSKPFNFFEGALRAGSANNFDIVAFHAYPIFNNTQPGIDFDRDQQTWNSRGGYVIGKARFLRDVMARYGINKPLFLNETGLRCHPSMGTACQSGAYEDSKANHIVRMVVRSVASQVDAFIWYVLEGPGWQEAGLLDSNQQPRLAFNALKHLNVRLLELRTPLQSQTVNYGTGLESYRFSGNGFVLDVIWSVDATTRQISLPASAVIAAYSRDGNPITPTISGGIATFNVGFENIYLKRQP